MSVLLLRLSGPMQSWGTKSRFTQRDTGHEPSRSGVIGLLCAALGWPRERSLEEFGPLKMAVRADREGRFMRDYHTATEVRRADAAKSLRETVLSERFYLADADFLVGLEGQREFLTRLGQALITPVWVLALGRKSFVPSWPVFVGVHEGPLIDVLRSAAWMGRRDEKPPAQLRFVVEVPYGQGEPRQDVPLSFISRARKFGARHVMTEFHPPAKRLEVPHVPQQVDSQSARPSGQV